MNNKIEQQKKMAAEAALQYVEEKSIIGIGTGSTVQYFIQALGKIKTKIEGAVSSSEKTTEALKQQGILVYDLNAVSEIAVYIDSADEVNDHLQLIKGLGGALTREKIIACVAKKFICIANENKKVKILGKNAPLPIEVLPIARSYVAREIVKIGGDPVYRQGFVTDNKNIILDIYNFPIIEPLALEHTLNNIEGVVANGLFAIRPADHLLLATEKGVTIIDSA